jgi:hypothetical protein
LPVLTLAVAVIEKQDFKDAIYYISIIKISAFKMLNKSLIKIVIFKTKLTKQNYNTTSLNQSKQINYEQYKKNGRHWNDRFSRDGRKSGFKYGKKRLHSGGVEL